MQNPDPCQGRRSNDRRGGRGRKNDHVWSHAGEGVAVSQCLMVVVLTPPHSTTCPHIDQALEVACMDNASELRRCGATIGGFFGCILSCCVSGVLLMFSLATPQPIFARLPSEINTFRLCVIAGVSVSMLLLFESDHKQTPRAGNSGGVRQ